LIFKVIFALSELESVEYLQQTNVSSFINPITLTNSNQRSFTFSLIGRECNYTWTVFKQIYPTNSSFVNIDTNLNLCTRINYPSSDSLTSDDSGLLIIIEI
jgi:hypothetical protein